MKTIQRKLTEGYFFHGHLQQLPFNLCSTITVCIFTNYDSNFTVFILSFQFTQFMTLVREMISRVETEQKAKLQQLRQMQEETKYVIILYSVLMLNLGLRQTSQSKHFISSLTL